MRCGETQVALAGVVRACGYCGFLVMRGAVMVVIGSALILPFPFLFPLPILVLMLIMMLLILAIRHFHILDPNLRRILYPTHEPLLIIRIERQAHPTLARPARPPRPMNVRLDVLGRFELHNQVHLRDIEAPGGDVCGDDALYPALFEVAEDVLALFLGDVAVEHFRGLPQVGFVADLVRLFLCLSEDDCAA